jgi:hypothetical protein
VIYAGGKSSNEKQSHLSTMVSFAADLDLVFDWIFCILTWNENQKSLQDKIIAEALLCFTIIATLMWIAYVSNGRILSIFPENMTPRKINSGTIALLCILLEDIPQLVLTYLIEKEFTPISMMNLVSSSYDMILKLCEVSELRHEEVILKKMLHHEKISAQKSRIELRLRVQSGTQDVDTKMSDLLSLVQYLIENADYHDAKQKCNEGIIMLSRHQQDEKTPFWKWSNTIIESLFKSLEENHESCANLFGKSLMIFEEMQQFFSVSKNTSCLMMTAFLQCLTSCYEGMYQTQYDAFSIKLQDFRRGYLTEADSVYWSFTSKRIFFEADFMNKNHIVDPERFISKFSRFIKNAKKNGVHSHIFADAHHGIARLYFWKLKDIHAAEKHFKVALAARKKEYKKHDIRYLRLLLDFFMCLVMSCKFRQSHKYAIEIQNGLLEYNKYHNNTFPVSYYNMGCKYYILCAMIPKNDIWKSVSFVNPEKSIDSYFQETQEFWFNKVMKMKRKNIYNLEIQYLFSVYYHMCRNERKRKHWLKTCKSYGNENYMYSYTLVMNKAISSLISWENANECFEIVFSHRIDEEKIHVSI